MKRNIKKFLACILCATAIMAVATSCKHSADNEKKDAETIAQNDTSSNKSLDGYNKLIQIKDNKIIPVNGKGTIVDFNATWCPPCREMAPIFDKFADEYGTSLNFISIDVDKNPELAGTYNVTSIPCIVFLGEEGREISRQIGLIPEEAFAQILNKVYPEAMP